MGIRRGIMKDKQTNASGGKRENKVIMNKGKENTE